MPNSLRTDQLTHFSDTRTPRLHATSAFFMLLRRLLSASYDCLLVIAITLVAGLPLPLLPEAFTVSAMGRGMIFSGMVLICFCYFGLSWTRAGQTVGMRAWRLKLVKADSPDLLSWMDTVRRFITALPSWGLAGIGILWLLFDRQQRTWHDRLSGSTMVLLPKRTKAARTKAASAANKH